MKRGIFLIFLFASISYAQEDPAPYDYKRDGVFQYAKPIKEVSPTGYNRHDCVFANRLVRTMVNRFRATSFQMERRCRERSGEGVCLKFVGDLDTVMDKLNRQYTLIKEKCVKK